MFVVSIFKLVAPSPRIFHKLLLFQTDLLSLTKIHYSHPLMKYTNSIINICSLLMKYTNNVFKEKKKNCVNIEVTHNISKLMIVNKYLVYNLVVFAQMTEVGSYPESLVET